MIDSVSGVNETLAGSGDQSGTPPTFLQQLRPDPHCLSFPGPAAARVSLSASPEHASLSLKTDQPASANSKVNPPP